MERFIWKASLRFESFPISINAGATDGQISWAFINSLIDYDEEREKVHEKCMDEWESTFCPICNEKVSGGSESTEEIKKKYADEIYRPGDDIPMEIEDSPEARERRLEIEEFLQRTRDEAARLTGNVIQLDVAEKDDD